MRGTRVKTQAVVKGELTVSPDLPEYIRHGLFAKPGAVYKVAARLSNEPSHIQPDIVNGPRGLTLKVYSVEGQFMDGANGSTQDFHFNNAQPLELR